MTFRIPESESAGRQRAHAKLLGRNIDANQRDHSRITLDEIIDRCGPVVESYPMWHPLVAARSPRQSSVTMPNDDCGYRGLDHTILLRNAIITCPYNEGKELFESVEKIAESDYLDGVASISAAPIEAQLYHPSADPILIQCDWERPMASDGTIPAAVAVPLLLEREVPNWRRSQAGETWETMSRYLLGQPSGSRSSLFVNQQTGQTIKTIWKLLNETGMYGPIEIRS